MKKVFIITGANGFLGNNIVRKLVEDKDTEVRALVLPNDKANALEGLNCKIYKGDVTKKDSLNDIFKIEESNVELYVIHCAAIVYIKSKYNPKVYEVNVNGTKNIIEKVLEKNAKLVYVSSVHAITEKPNNEIITEIKDFDFNKVEGQYAKTKAKIAKYVLEMVEEKKLNACYMGKRGQCYILSNRYVEIKELLDIISEVRNTKKIKLILPMWLAKLTAPLLEVYYSILKQPPLYTRYSLYTLGSNSNFSNEKAQRELNYKNRELRKTIKDIIIWLKEKHKINE